MSYVPLLLFVSALICADFTNRAVIRRLEERIAALEAHDNCGPDR
jgi:hypothetical protein